MLDLIKTRRSIRAFQATPVSFDNVQIILEAAMYAPSAKNRQPWHFIVVDDEDILTELSTKIPDAKALKTAPLCILLLSDVFTTQQAGDPAIDCAASMQNLLLAAHALGFGSCWIPVSGLAEREAVVNEVFDLPEAILPFAIAAVGHADETHELPRRYMTNKVHFNHW